MNPHTTYQGPLILAIHPRNSFTNIGVYRSQKLIFLKKVLHSSADRQDFKKYSDQTSYRSSLVLKELVENDIPIDQIKIIISRGGLVKPVKAGVYEVNKEMISDLESGVSGVDIVNIGGLIAHSLLDHLKEAKAYVADPVVVDEFIDFARVSGHPEFTRRSVFHALEQKSVARKYAKTVLKKYEDLNLIVAQLGNGITIGAHQKGRVIDANQGLDGDGPFSPSRSGNVPIGDLIKLCFSGKYTKNEVCKMITTDGGLFAYVGSHEGYTVDNMAIEGDKKAIFHLKAMAYQVSKTIGSMFTVLKGDVDAILLTGGLTHSKVFMAELTNNIKAIAPVHTYSSEDDVETLALNGYYLLAGELEPLTYS